MFQKGITFSVLPSHPEPQLTGYSELGRWGIGGHRDHTSQPPDWDLDSMSPSLRKENDDAVLMLCEASAQGYAPATNTYAFITMNGEGVVAEPAKAMDLWQLSVEQDTEHELIGDG